MLIIMLIIHSVAVPMHALYFETSYSNPLSIKTILYRSAEVINIISTASLLMTEMRSVSAVNAKSSAVNVQV